MQPKEHVFPVEVEWFGGRLVHAIAGPGTSRIEIATPPQFRGGMSGIWSPEDALVLAATSCFMLTLVSLCERQGIPLHELRTSAVGRVGHREDGIFSFTAVEMTVHAETPQEFFAALETAADTAKTGCIVGNALQLELQLELTVEPSEATSFLQGQALS